MSFGLSTKALTMIQHVFRSHAEIERVQVFGSRAIGNYRDNSDIDLVMWGTIDQRQLGAINHELDDLPLPYQFDLKVYSDIEHQSLREHIDKFGKDLYIK